MVRCTRYNIMWWSLTTTCHRSVVFSINKTYIVPPLYNWNIVEGGIKQHNHNPSIKSTHVYENVLLPILVRTKNKRDFDNFWWHFNMDFLMCDLYVPGQWIFYLSCPCCLKIGCKDLFCWLRWLKIYQHFTVTFKRLGDLSKAFQLHWLLFSLWHPLVWSSSKVLEV
jgi:hypothetical protein